MAIVIEIGHKSLILDFDFYLNFSKAKNETKQFSFITIKFIAFSVIQYAMDIFSYIICLFSS